MCEPSVCMPVYVCCVYNSYQGVIVLFQLFNTNPTLVLLQLQENEILSNKEDIDIVIIRCQAKFFVFTYVMLTRT